MATTIMTMATFLTNHNTLVAPTATVVSSGVKVLVAQVSLAVTHVDRLQDGEDQNHDDDDPPRPPPRGRSCTSYWPARSPRNSRATSPPRRSQKSLHVFSLHVITMLLVLMVIQTSHKITSSYSRWQVTKKVL